MAQLDESDCGAAVLSMILKNYGSDISISTIRKYSQTDKNGTSALGLIKAAKHFKLETKAVKADESLFDYNNKLPFPFIVHVNKNNGFLHYLLVLSFNKKGILVADPDPKEKIHTISYDDFYKIWTGIAIFCSPEPSYEPIKDNSDSLLQTAKLLFFQKKIIGTIILATFMSTMITIFGAIFLQKLVDTYVPNGDIDTLKIVSFGLLVSYIFYGIFNYVEGYLSTILGQRLSIDILLSYIKHVLNLPMSFFSTRKTGEITSRFSDANNIITTLSQTAITTILNLGTIIFIGFTLSLICFKLFAISLVTIPIYIIIVLFFYKSFDKLNNDRMEQNALLSSEIIEDIHGIETIKSLNVEDYSYSKIDHNFVKLLKINYKYNLTVIIQNSLKSTSQLIISLVILYFGSIMAIKNQITIGQLMAFNALMGYFMNPIESIVNLQNDLQTAKTANSRLNQIMLIDKEKNTGKNLKEENINNKLIQMTNVSFEYKYGIKTLDNINLSIKSGESVAIVGYSGSGKTTLAKMLNNLYTPQYGDIEINGQNIKNISNISLRDFINYVPQNPYIFSGSVMENICLGSKKKDIDSIINAAKIAEIDKEIDNLSDGYETNLSEDGNLSGGQLQRIAIARSIMQDTPVIVLDESTSNLDVLTEKKIVNNLLDLKNRTVIFIAHRLEIAKKVDKIFVMNDGKIVESGSHKDLINNKSYYYKLWED